jgi:hypothetical protein
MLPIVTFRAESKFKRRRDISSLAFFYLRRKTVLGKSIIGFNILKAALYWFFL